MIIKYSMRTKTSVLLNNHVRLKNVDGRVSAMIFFNVLFFKKVMMPFKNNFKQN